MKKIYIVEDQPLQVDMLKAVFKNHSEYNITYFYDGLELYKKVQEDPPDMLIVDIILPTLSGMAIIKLLKLSDLYTRIPILVISSITEDDIKEQVAKAGGNDFLAKPFQIKELLSKIETLVKMI